MEYCSTNPTCASVFTQPGPIADPDSKLSERLEHHQCINIAVCGMVEGKWQPPDDLEPEFLPETHRPLVRAHHEVELHAPISARSSVSQGVLAHKPCDAASGGSGAHHEAAVADVATTARLVRTHVVGPQDDPVLLDNEGLLVRSHPVGERLLLRHVPVERVGLTSTDDRLDDRPDSGGVFGEGGTDQHGDAHNGNRRGRKAMRR